MIRFILLIFFGCIQITLSAQDDNLKKRVQEFYKTEENYELGPKEKINALKTYVLPGVANDRMANFFYNSWNQLNETAKKLRTKIIDIQINETYSEAIVITKDIVTYKSGGKKIFISKSRWVYSNNMWYRSWDKSELYENAKRVR